ncbi:MAG: LptF/LptG family permease [Alphaproteobacteria bacterium]|nr:LptF/LptG family permease [Alphaproteobacteria bacterium]
MNLVTRHIFKHLFTSLIFLATVLTTGVWLTQSLRFVEIIVNQNVSIGGYFSLVGFLIPDLIAIILPICTLISVLFTYNKLIADHELSIFRTCGLSNLQLARPAFILAFFMACFVAFINIYLVPASFRHLRDMEHQFRNKFSSSFVQDGMFNTLRGVTVYAKTRSLNGDLGGVFIHSIGQGLTGGLQKRNPFTIVAQNGAIVEKEGKKSLLMLFNGTRQEKDLKTGKISFFHFKTLSYDLDQLGGNIQERIVKPYERPLSDLLYPSNAENLSETTKAQLYSEGHQRLFPPLLVLLFTLIGLSALLPQELNRRGRQKYIIKAIALASCIHVGLIFLVNINGRWQGAIPLAYVLIIFFSLVSLFILENQNIRFWWQRYSTVKE